MPSPSAAPGASRDPSPAPGAPATEGSHAAGGHAWLAALEGELAGHRAVRHPLLARFAAARATRADALAFGLQHHALVGAFTRYMELLLLAAPDASQKLWLAKVLVNEYGEGSDGRDHATLYGEFLAAAGAAPGEPERTPLCAEAWDFIDAHLALCRREPFLVGLGALGPGHEWAIPAMFHQLIPGLAAAGLSADDRLYFDLHTEQDVDHGAWMSEVLAARVRTAADRALVRRGALASLEARARLWDAVERRLDDPAAAAREASPGDLRALRAAVDAVIAGRAETLRPR